MTSLPFTPFIAVILLLLPVKLRPRTLIKLAFLLWALGGGVLAAVGVLHMVDAAANVEPGVILMASLMWLANWL
jgi:hypothetical protein